jgi:hypothetical protein
MGHAMVRISERTRETLREIARAQQLSMQAILEKAVEEYRRKKFFEDLDAAYAELQKDPEAWEAYQADLRVGDAVLMDGLDEDEDWGEDGTPGRKARS